MKAVSPSALVRAQVALESYRLSADGSTIVYVLRRVAGDDYVSHLFTRPLRGGRPRQLTRGAVRDGSPDLSPDGRRLAFVRTPVGSSAASAASAGARTAAGWRSSPRPATHAS
jgi:Tol biopolymer transport system component